VPLYFEPVQCLFGAAGTSTLLVQGLGVLPRPSEDEAEAKRWTGRVLEPTRRAKGRGPALTQRSVYKEPSFVDGEC